MLGNQRERTIFVFNSANMDELMLYFAQILEIVGVNPVIPKWQPLGNANSK